MKKKLIFVFFIVFLTLYFYRNFFNENQLEGVYVNRNFENEWLTDLPLNQDTLIIKKNNQIQSLFFGNSSYDLESDLKGTKINVYFKNDNGEDEGSYTFSISRVNIIGKPKITLNNDLDHYYEKLSK